MSQSLHRRDICAVLGMNVYGRMTHVAALLDDSQFDTALRELDDVRRLLRAHIRSQDREQVLHADDSCVSNGAD